MRSVRRPLGFIAVLTGLILIPVVAAGTPPGLVEVCHLSSHDAPEERRWVRIEVSAKALEKHLAHGDGLAGELVPGTIDGSVFDGRCIPQSTGSPTPPVDPPSSQDPPELIFAVAYTDTDPGDGGYNAAVDVLIAKLIDGPGDAGDGVVGPGDLIVTHRYPKDFGPSSHGTFAVTEHTITDLGPGLSYVCNVKSGSNQFVWSSGEGEFDLYQEFASATPEAKIIDGRVSWASDHLEVPASSPSQPLDPVEPITGSDPADQTFLDVEADCSG